MIERELAGMFRIVLVGQRSNMTTDDIVLYVNQLEMDLTTMSQSFNTKSTVVVTFTPKYFNYISCISCVCCNLIIIKNVRFEMHQIYIKFTLINIFRIKFLHNVKEK